MCTYIYIYIYICIQRPPSRPPALFLVEGKGFKGNLGGHKEGGWNIGQHEGSNV